MMKRVHGAKKVWGPVLYVERATYSGDGGKCHALYAGFASVDVVEEVFM